MQQISLKTSVGWAQVRYEMKRGHGELFRVDRRSGQISLKQTVDAHSHLYTLVIAAFDGGQPPTPFLFLLIYCLPYLPTCEIHLTTTLSVVRLEEQLTECSARALQAPVRLACPSRCRRGNGSHVLSCRIT